MLGFLSLCLSCILVSCSLNETQRTPVRADEGAPIEKSISLGDIRPRFADGDVNALIEIPAGTLEKWEFNKTTGEMEWDVVDDVPRVIKYLGYPGNYGMVPGTLLPKEKGGDGDPLDILVLGPPVERGHFIKCKIIGVLYLLDGAEQDDKLIAVSTDSPLYHVNSMEELDQTYPGITQILEVWFSHYKGAGIMESKGFGEGKDAIPLLDTAISAFVSSNTHPN